jgi:triphosphatase
MRAKGRPEHEHRSAQHEGRSMRAKGRPEHEHRSAQHEGRSMRAKGRPEHEHRGAQHEGGPVRAKGAPLTATESGDVLPVDAPAPPSIPTEIELKLAIDPAAVPALLVHPALRAVKRGRARLSRLVSTYLDTPEFRLAKRGIVLRVRQDGVKWRQTVKGPPLAEAGGALHARPEYEWPLAAPRLDPSLLAETPWRKLLATCVRNGTLRGRFTTDFERRAIPLQFADGTRASLCVDLGTIRTATRDRRRVPIAEIEIELESGEPRRLFELALALAADLPLTAAAANKAERGVALVHGHPDGWRAPERARAVPLRKGTRAGPALAAIAAECLRQVAANAAGLLADRDPEWIHQMRVGTRRLRSCLTLMAPFVVAADAEFVATEAKWLAGALGPARDWDVFATETLPPLAAHFAGDTVAASDLARLRARLAPRRRAAREVARAAVRSPRFTRLLLTAGALCASPALATPPVTDGESPPAARRYAIDLLTKRHRKLGKRGAGLAVASPEERHAVRIAAKKMRYAADFFAPLFPPNRARAYLRALACLQDALGHFADATTAARLAGELAGTDVAAATAAGAVRGWSAARAAALEPELLAAWQAAADAPVFWRSK